jgi:ABC-type polysaccharide transport system permease subunit
MLISPNNYGVVLHITKNSYGSEWVGFGQYHQWLKVNSFYGVTKVVLLVICEFIDAMLPFVID